MTAFLDSIGYAQWVLHALVLIPLAGIPLILLAPERAARHVALVVTTLELVVSAGLWWHFDPAGGMQYHTLAPWLPRWLVSALELHTGWPLWASNRSTCTTTTCS